MFHLSSRVHRLNHFPEIDVSCYVKRDDELGCGISGTKQSTLKPAIKRENTFWWYFDNAKF